MPQLRWCHRQVNRRRTPRASRCQMPCIRRRRVTSTGRLLIRLPMNLIDFCKSKSNSIKIEDCCLFKESVDTKESPVDRWQSRHPTDIFQRIKPTARFIFVRHNVEPHHRLKRRKCSWQRRQCFSSSIYRIIHYYSVSSSSKILLRGCSVP